MASERQHDDSDSDALTGGDNPFTRLNPLAELFLRMTNRTMLKRPYIPSPEAIELHQSLTVADLHCDALLSNRDLLERSERGHVDIPRLSEGNVALQVFSIPTLAPVRAGIPWVPTEADAIALLIAAQGWPPETFKSTFERVLHAVRLLRDAEARSNGQFRILVSSARLEDYLREREADTRLTAGLIGVEGLHSLEGKLENLDVFFDIGVRTAGLVHLADNDLGGSAHGRRQPGLTPFGADVLARMEEQRMLVDLAHASPQLMDDVLERATRPLMISHTGLKGAHDNERNITDEHAHGIAETGGIIGIGYFPWAIGACCIDSILKTLLYAVELVGVEHVALGSDFDGMVATPFDTSGVVLLTDALLQQGMSPGEIGLIMGGNAVRLLRDALPDK